MTNRISDNFKTQDMCNKAVEKDPWSLVEVPNNFKTHKMCNKAVKKDLCPLMNVPDCFLKKDICIEAVGKYPFLLAGVQIILKHKKCVTRQLE